MLLKILGSLLLASTITIGVLGWQLKNSYEDNGILKANVSQLEQSVQDWEKSFDDLNNILEDTNASLEAREKELAKSRNLTTKWSALYEAEKEHNKELREWANASPPAIWWDGLRKSIENRNDKGSSGPSTP